MLLATSAALALTLSLGPVTKPGPMGDYRISLHTPCTLNGGPSQDAPIVESLQTLDGEQEITASRRSTSSGPPRGWWPTGADRSPALGPGPR